MNSKITFLGVGGDSYIVGKQVLSSGGIIIRVDGMQFHVDPGPGSLVKAKQYDINLRENTALFVSHNHLNHSNDTNAVISAMTNNGEDKRGVFLASKSVIEGDKEVNPIVTKFHSNCVEKTIIMEPGKKVGIGNVDIVATPTKHNDKEGIGFKFFTQNFVLSYLGDTAYTSELVEAHKGCDIAIINLVNPKEIKNNKQMNTEDAINLLKKIKPSLAIITHFGIKMLSADPINEARTIQRESGVQTIAAKDGMVLNPQSYSALIKQKTLNLY
jgi:ribonuclease BN (tRNA processing enzyme)